MKKVIENYFDAIYFLRTDDCVSFYTYFTIILAECAFLWSHYSASMAIPFTIILVAYIINVAVTGVLKGYWEGDRKELVFSILYVVNFICLFVIGCCIKLTMCIVLTGIPLIITAIWIQLRTFQDTTGISEVTDKLRKINFIWYFVQLIVLGVPYALFLISIIQIHTLPIILKVLILILYLLCIPFIVLLEEEFAAINIFELAYDIMWSKELEEFKKKSMQQDYNEVKNDESQELQTKITSEQPITIEMKDNKD